MKRFSASISLLLLVQLALSAPADNNKPQPRGHDPEEHLDVPGIIQHWGYPSETIYVTTQDGYILQMHHIPHGRNGSADPNRPVVFMQHGLLCASSNWVENLPNEAAGFMFADAGFDVWMGNMRGNTYGREHTTLNPNHHDFWKFSWDEMAKYDLEAMINEVLHRTGKDKLYYMGHSQGTLTMFAKLITDQSFGPSKINRFFALAPVSTVGHIRGLLSIMGHTFGYGLEEMMLLFGQDEFLPSDGFIAEMSHLICGIFDHGNVLCDNVLFLIAGPDSKQLNSSRVDVYMAHEPAGTSTINMVHWTQMVKSDKMEMYDYGSKRENMAHYGQNTPPLYDMTKINVPTHLYWSEYDWLADQTDIQNNILPKIPAQYLAANVHLHEFNHLDFIWGMRAPAEIYLPIINIIRQDQQKESMSQSH